MTDLIAGKRKLKNGSPSLDRETLNQVFLVNPDNYGFLLGTRTHLGEWWNRNWIVFPGLCVLTIFSLYMVLLSFQGIRDFTLLLIHGQSTDSKVTSRRWTEGNRSSNNYLTYKFTAGEQTYTREQSVNRNFYEAHPVGSTLPIYYAASEPQISEIQGSNYHLIAMTMPPIGALVSLAGTVFWVRKLYKLRRLESHGYLLDGEVIRCYGTRGSKGHYSITLRYSFNTPDEKLIEAKVNRGRDDLDSALLPPIGTRIPVLYLDEKNFRAL